MSTHEISHALRLRILRGQAAPGQALPQDDLARDFGVSKIPVREALQRLHTEGVVELLPNRGAVVRTLDAARAREIYALRSALEPVLLSEAIPRLTMVDLAEAAQALTSPAPAPEANWLFHRALYRPSGWQHGLAVLEPMFVVVAPYLLLYTQDLGGAAVSDKEHASLLAHCRDGDIKAAMRVLASHLETAKAALVAHLG